MNQQIPPDTESDDTASFGYRDVSPSEKPALVGAVFSAVADRYDIMNDLMSGGLHRLWKRQMVAAIRPDLRGPVLDLAGGTGDIADKIIAAGKTVAPITVCDINPEMLRAGRERSWNKGQLGTHLWACGDAESLPFENSQFGACTIAFGIRNVTHIDQALADIRRVLKPGGQFLCLEFSPDVLPLLKPLYDRFSFQVIPQIGQMVTGNADAYRYLVESIRRFPESQTFKTMVTDAGFGGVRVQKLSSGIVCLTTGWRV